MNILSALSLILLVSSRTTGATDETQTPGASGASVVEAAIHRIEASCIFDDDKLFLRRLAYVESNDGLHPDTFRSGYDGGVWQVDQIMYDQTKGPTLQSYIQGINAGFQIDWMTTSWSDLRKPLHSALAARLYIQQNSSGIVVDIPRSVLDQANFWQSYYRPGGDIDDFVDASEQLEQGCQSKGLDLVFVLDSSGSIGSSYFDNIKQFVIDVVNRYDIGSDKTRVGIITFSSSASLEFDLDTYSTKNDVINEAMNIAYIGGGTDTAQALGALVDHSFQEVNGARPLSQGHPRVAVVLTDGYSNSQAATVAAANRVHAADITMLAIGVGNYLNNIELEAIAGDPVCQNLFTLGFSDLDSLFHAIETRACAAPIILEAVNGAPIVIGPGNQNCQLLLVPGGVTIKLTTYSGSGTFYIATDTYPSASYYENMTVSVPDSNGVIYIPGSGQVVTIYCSIQGGNGTNGTVGIEIGDHDWCRSNPCQNGGTCADQGDTYACIQEQICDPNECVHGQWYCTCDPGYTGANCDEVIPAGHNCGDNNPCTADNIQQHKFYHAHEDPTKFVQCSQWGQCYEMPCSPGLVWNPDAYTCTYP